MSACLLSLSVMSLLLPVREPGDDDTKFRYRFRILLTVFQDSFPCVVFRQ